jgi:hypothetical protein
MVLLNYIKEGFYEICKENDWRVIHQINWICI